MSQGSSTGTRSNYDYGELVSDAGLEIARLDRYVIGGMPKTHSTMYRGTALARK